MYAKEYMSLLISEEAGLVEIVGGGVELEV